MMTGEIYLALFGWWRSIKSAYDHHVETVFSENFSLLAILVHTE